ncbi:hypothetical protein M758_9G044900 [Ceratodon purpureus]|nr:hypothetical protein M758_9G044900 [Ceratodon purpureus]
MSTVPSSSPPSRRAGGKHHGLRYHYIPRLLLSRKQFRRLLCCNVCSNFQPHHVGWSCENFGRGYVVPCFCSTVTLNSNRLDPMSLSVRLFCKILVASCSSCCRCSPEPAVQYELALKYQCGWILPYLP